MPNILLVEDNKENRDVMAHFLKKIGVVSTASDGPSSVEICHNQKFDLILMDINLGLGMNGIEATKRIRQIDGYADTPIIAVTAYAMAGDRETFMKIGCTHYISKPFTKKEFVSLVEEVLGSVNPGQG
ncbi:response regulator [Ignavibacteriales bacterium]